MTPNLYGQRLRDHYEKYRRDELEAMEDPTAFFVTTGDQMAAEIAELTETIAGPTPPGEDYVTRVGRRTAAARTAADEVMRKYLAPGLSPQPLL